MLDYFIITNPQFMYFQKNKSDDKISARGN